jgi:hypothetical protein
MDREQENKKGVTMDEEMFDEWYNDVNAAGTRQRIVELLTESLDTDEKGGD